MSNLPGDLSADPSGETLPAGVSIRSTAIPEASEKDAVNPACLIDERKTGHAVQDTKERPSSVSSSADTAIPGEKSLGRLDKEGDEDEDEEDDNHVGGIKLRDLSGSEVQQFPGIKREKWWSVCYHAYVVHR